MGLVTELEPPPQPAIGRWTRGVEWPAALWIAAVHLGVLAAPFVFTWKGLVVMLVLGWATGGLGICLGFHRLLTHGSFETWRPVRWLLALLGTLAGEGPPIMWVAAHRKHHFYSDQEDDPHSPRHGGWWSHVLWMLPRYGAKHWSEMYRRFAPDLLKDPFLRLLNRTFLWWHVAMAAVLFTVGWLGWDVRTGLSFLVYGMSVRLVYVLHVTWFVNSASHMWGYRNFETPDDSRNLWWVGLLAFGEGWHNNHHASQRSARHGLRWWELDVTYLTICLMERCGLAWRVSRDPAPHGLEIPLAANRQSETSDLGDIGRNRSRSQSVPEGHARVAQRFIAGDVDGLIGGESRRDG